MKKRTKQAICFIFCLSLISFILLSIITVYRENSYDKLVQSHQLSEEMRNEAMDEKREYTREYLKVYPVNPPLDEIFDDPVMAEYVAEIHAKELEYEYYFRIDLVPEICKRESNAFPMRFFYSYGKLISFENCQLVGAQGFLTAEPLGPFSGGGSVFNDMGKAIYAWESEGNTREGDWLNRFLISPEYETFLQNLCEEIESFEGKSLENIVAEIQNVPIEDYDPLSKLKTPFLQDAKELAAVVFKDYERDKEQGNISRIAFEAKIIQTLYERVQYVEKRTLSQCRNLRWPPNSSFPDPFVDLGGILASSLIISLVVTYLVSRKYWK